MISASVKTIIIVKILVPFIVFFVCITLFFLVSCAYLVIGLRAVKLAREQIKN
jgi:hypothetical protein